MKTRTNILLAVTLILLPAALGQAAELDVSALPSQIGSLPTTPGDTLKLDLAGAHQLALARNLSLHVGRYDLAIADANVRGSGGIFDPMLQAYLNLDSTKSPTSTILDGANVAESENGRFGIGINQLLPSGAEVGLEWSSRRGKTNSTFFFLNPQWNANLRATLTQPLLNGFGTIVNRSQIIISENIRSQTAVGFEVQVIDLLAQVEQAYWELVATREAIAVRQQSMALAERLLEETRQRVEVGTSAPIDMVQSGATGGTWSPGGFLMFVGDKHCTFRMGRPRSGPPRLTTLKSFGTAYNSASRTTKIPSTTSGLRIGDTAAIFLPCTMFWKNLMSVPATTPTRWFLSMMGWLCLLPVAPIAPVGVTALVGL